MDRDTNFFNFNLAFSGLIIIIRQVSNLTNKDEGVVYKTSTCVLEIMAMSHFIFICFFNLILQFLQNFHFFTFHKFISSHISYLIVYSIV